MESIGDLHWKIACLTVQKKVLVLLLNTEKDRVDKREVWDMFADIEATLPPSHHPKADEALVELSGLLEHWEISKKRHAQRSRVCDAIEEGDEEAVSSADEELKDVIVKKFPRRRGVVGGERRKDFATAAAAPVIDENPLDVAERIVSALRCKKTVPKRDATELRLVHECVRDVEISRYVHMVRVHYAALLSRPGVEDEVLAECLSATDAFFAWLGKLRVPDCAQQTCRTEIANEVRALARRCRPLYPQRRFLEVYDANAMADSLCSPLLALLPVHELLRAHLEYEIPELSPVTHFEGVEGTFFTARRVGRTEVLWQADPGLRTMAKKLASRLGVYIRDLFLECFERTYGTAQSQDHGSGLILSFDTRNPFTGPRLKTLLQNALMCTRRNVEEVLQLIIGQQAARKLSRVDRWCEPLVTDAAPEERTEAIEIVCRLFPTSHPDQVLAVFNRLSPWVRQSRPSVDKLDA